MLLSSLLIRTKVGNSQLFMATQILHTG
jgi:hypothetical protein